MKSILITLTLVLVSFAGISNLLAGEVVTSGTFIGQSDHETAGLATIERDEAGNYFVVLGDDFKLDGAPDPKVGLGKDGYDEGAKLGHLQKKKGTQKYAIPANLNPEDFNEIWIWCERFSVPLGVAKLS